MEKMSGLNPGKGGMARETGELIGQQTFLIIHQSEALIQSGSREAGSHRGIITTNKSGQNSISDGRSSV